MMPDPDPMTRMQERVQQFSEEFDAHTAQRHEMGAEKYGPVMFLEIDSLAMALEEVVDLANYARYTYVKLRLLMDMLKEQKESPLGKGAVANPYKKEKP